MSPDFQLPIATDRFSILILLDLFVPSPRNSTNNLTQPHSSLVPFLTFCQPVDNTNPTGLSKTQVYLTTPDLNATLPIGSCLNSMDWHSNPLTSGHIYSFPAAVLHKPCSGAIRLPATSQSGCGLTFSWPLCMHFLCPERFSSFFSLFPHLRSPTSVPNLLWSLS